MALDFNNQEWAFRPARLKHWGTFVRPEHKVGRILVAGLGEFEKALAPDATFFEMGGDYNSSTEPSILMPTAVYCFEVLEHLINPGNLLWRIRYGLSRNAPLYVSFPTGRPTFLWTDGHFHEFQCKRAEKLFEMCGLSVVRKTITPPIRMKWYEYLRGWRPMLRLIWPLRCAIYELRRAE